MGMVTILFETGGRKGFGPINDSRPSLCATTRPIEKFLGCLAWGSVEAVHVRRIAVIAKPAPANNCPRVMRYACVSGPVRRVG